MNIVLSLLFILFFIPYVTVAASCDEGMTASTPTSSFLILSNDEVVIDLRTGLMWQRCLYGFSGADCQTKVNADKKSYTYEDSLKLISTINEAKFAGFSDWRMPNIKELRSIVEERCSNLALNIEIFPYVEDSKESYALQFSNTPRSFRESGAAWVWGIDFLDGSMEAFSVGSINTDSAPLQGNFRLVRNAQ